MKLFKTWQQYNKLKPLRLYFKVTSTHTITQICIQHIMHLRIYIQCFISINQAPKGVRLPYTFSSLFNTPHCLIYSNDIVPRLYCTTPYMTLFQTTFYQCVLTDCLIYYKDGVTKTILLHEHNVFSTIICRVIKLYYHMTGNKR